MVQSETNYLHMRPQKRSNNLGIRTCGLTSNSTPSSILTKIAPTIPYPFSGLSNIARKAWTL